MISARSEPTTAAAAALSRHDSGSMKRRNADAARSDDASAKKPKQQGSYSDHDDAASRLESQGVHVSPTPGVQSDSQDDGYHSQMSVELAASIPPAAAGSARKRGAAGARHSDGGNGSRRDSEPYVRETVPAAASGVRSPVSSQDHSDPDSVRHTHAHIRTRTYSNMHIQRHAHTATRTYSDTHIQRHAHTHACWQERPVAMTGSGRSLRQMAHTNKMTVSFRTQGSKSDFRKKLQEDHRNKMKQKQVT
jgi:hypothetical protein